MFQNVFGVWHDCYVSANGIQVLITTGVSMVAVLFCFFASNNVLSRKEAQATHKVTRTDIVHVTRS